MINSFGSAATKAPYKSAGSVAVGFWFLE